MWRQFKRYFQLCFGLFLCIATLLVGWSMLRESSQKLTDAQKYSGRIKSQKTGKEFAFTINSSPLAFSFYRPNRNYSDLISALAIGDSVDVYAITSATAGTQVIQVEKQGQVIVDKSLLEGQNKTGGYLCLIGSCVFLVLAIRHFRKSGLQRD